VDESGDDLEETAHVVGVAELAPHCLPGQEKQHFELEEALDYE
jgi:hypothetical protein